MSETCRQELGRILVVIQDYLLVYLRLRIVFSTSFFAVLRHLPMKGGPIKNVVIRACETETFEFFFDGDLKFVSETLSLYNYQIT